jgi:hypothetical protein
MKNIERKEAVRSYPDYVAFVEGNFSKFNVVEKAFSKLKKGQKVITYNNKEFKVVKISSL